MKKALAATLLMTLLAATAQALAFVSFEQADANKDGKVTQEELRAAGIEYKDSLFSKADANGDGVLSREEYKVFNDGIHSHS